MVEIDPEQPMKPINNPEMKPVKDPKFKNTPEATPHNSSQSGGFSNFKQFLGEKGYKTFMNNLAQGVSQQIKKQRERDKQTAERLRKSETGEE